MAIVPAAGGGGTPPPPVTKRQTLTITQMYGLARLEGLNPEQAAVAAAIGMAESSGRSWVISANPDGGVNVGIYQLDTQGKGAGYTVAQLQDPGINTQAMIKGSSKGTDFSAWQTYAQGTYKKFMGGIIPTMEQDVLHGGNGGSFLGNLAHGVETAWNDTGGKVASDVKSGLQNLLSLPDSVLGFFSALEQPVQAAMWLFNPSNWARIIAGIFGFFLLIAGLVTLGMSA